MNAVDPPATLEADLLQALLDEHTTVTLPRLRRLWDYYRNPTNDQGKPAQYFGLPQRLRHHA
ncbi:MAG: hypothetical protein IT445_03930, partial [Phycisphaeraceae bacterium]|nr:hypothetical protein [Phycisphaeraceae bacterium]